VDGVKAACQKGVERVPHNCDVQHFDFNLSNMQHQAYADVITTKPCPNSVGTTFLVTKGSGMFLAGQTRFCQVNPKAGSLRHYFSTLEGSR
jgi:hypothetical protein